MNHFSSSSCFINPCWSNHDTNVVGCL